MRAQPVEKHVGFFVQRIVAVALGYFPALFHYFDIGFGSVFPADAFRQA